MKKIIFFAKDLNKDDTGKSLITLLNRLIKTYNITLVLENNKGELKRDLNKKVKIIELKQSKLKTLLFKIKHKNKYDFSCTLLVNKEFSKLSLISSKNNSIYIQNNYKYIYKKQEFINFFNNLNIKKFMNIIFTSNESEKYFCRYYSELKEKTYVINNLINTKEIQKKSKEQLKIKKEKEDIIFTYIGELDEEHKKISRTLECFKKIISKNKHIKLWIIGDGEENNNIKTFIIENKLSNNITLFEKEKNPYKYLKNSNYLIQTPDYEGFPIIFNEANLLGKIVFTTIKISDEYFNVNNGECYIIPTEINLMAKNILGIIKTNPKVNKLNYDKINKERVEKIKELIEKQSIE